MRLTTLVSVVAVTSALLIGTAVAFAAYISGTDGPDRLVGTSEPDRISGAGGDDVILGKTDRDRLNGDSASDHIFGGQGQDRIFADTGERDVLRGGDNDDYLNTDDDRSGDLARGGAGFDVCDVDRPAGPTSATDSRRGCERLE